METPKQHKLDILASNLLFLSLVLGTAVNYFTKTGFFASDFKMTKYTAVGFVIAIPFLVFQYYCIRKGKRWAKILFVVLLGLSILFDVLGYKRLAVKLNTPASVVNYIFQYVLQLIAAVMILRSLKESKRLATVNP